MSKKRIILRNGRFAFLKGKPTKTYLTFYTGITKSEISAYFHSLFFGLCKVLFQSPFYREYWEQLELNFGNPREDYFMNVVIYNNLSHVLHIYLGLRYTKVSVDPNLAELLEQKCTKKGCSG